ncbi:MAG: hypothetical protein BGP22_34830 [Variovorax sp. 67-131]|nr:MAG: hypothetical protein ABS94_17815 [Variovorax sp. SCN 67-85]ODV17130.1 MAG: hypothetical protein ABT25_30075 [Variovorax sp. SCN 67-20]OJZ09385.1 MAG: hypothetical protein BGP22_34830 [Variovorax sp. 67-131]
MPNQGAILMQNIQDLDTSGARAAETFVHGGTRYLVVPQLAVDVPGQPAMITVGDSNVDALVYRWQDEAFVPHARLPVPGGEDAEFFEIGARAFLATASLKSGTGPYELNVESVIFELKDGVFTEFQRVPTFAAKQWTHFAIGGRHFLALAQGVAMEGTVPRHPSKSAIFEWNGERFAEFQVIDSVWGYNFAFFEIGGQSFLAYADHVAPSRVMRWNGTRFEDFQLLEGKTGRAFQFFEHGAQAWLAFACLHDDTVLLRWDGVAFVRHQTLCGPGGREFVWREDAQGGELVQINFLLGSREAPVTSLTSVGYRFADGQLMVRREFPTLGGTDACAFEDKGHAYLVVANSLGADIRFRTPSKVYRLETEEGAAP